MSRRLNITSSQIPSITFRFCANTARAWSHFNVQLFSLVFSEAQNNNKKEKTLPVIIFTINKPWSRYSTWNKRFLFFCAFFLAVLICASLDFIKSSAICHITTFTFSASARQKNWRRHVKCFWKDSSSSSSRSSNCIRRQRQVYFSPEWIQERTKERNDANACTSIAQVIKLKKNFQTNAQSSELLPWTEQRLGSSPEEKPLKVLSFQTWTSVAYQSQLSRFATRTILNWNGIVHVTIITISN